MNHNKKLVVRAIGASLLVLASSVQAANWLTLQGTEKDGASKRAHVWGFVQPEYQSTSGTKLEGGPWKGQSAIFNQIGPDLKTNESFGIRRARIGVRGTGLPLDPRLTTFSKVNYFFLAEFGNNGITRVGGDGSAKITDASITLNHIPGARIRVGTFKTPGSEEGLQAIHVFDYINFTNVTNGLTFERFFDGDGSGTAGNGSAGNSQNDANTPNGPVGAFRDTGIQVFDTFKVANWEHTYALMYGNGNGISRGDNDDNKDLHLYWSSELVFGGKGARRQGLKMFIWNQDGKRTLTTEGAGEYDRTRSGLGATFRKDKYRAAFEYITADGMIFNGTDGGAVAGSIANNSIGAASFNVETKGEADGAYVHFGYAVMPELELDIRYDVYNRMTDVAAKERKFETTTLGAQYFFNKKSRATINYEFRDAEAPNAASIAGPNQVLGSIDDRLSVQLITIF